MEQVLGIGGLFFRSHDPGALAAWYETHLGVRATPKDYETPPWFQTAGATVFQPFPATTDYFGRAEQAWMVNFRVRALDTMVSQLREAGLLSPGPLAGLRATLRTANGIVELR